jgi:parvulin-like peptidyl-prolyl isomerase
MLTSLALVVAGCGGTSSAVLRSDDVAVVGSQHVTKDQFRELMDRAKRSYEAGKQPFPKAGSTQYEQLKSQVISFLVRRAEYDQKAQDMGIHVSDSDVQKRLASDKKQFFAGSEKKFQAYLTQQGLTEAQAPAEWKAKLISQKLFDKVTSDLKVSDAEARTYYDLHKSQYVQPERREVRHILVPKKALADRLYAQLKGGANFAKLAKKYSKDPGSAANGGKLTISKGQTVPQFNTTAFSLKKGELAAPIKTTYGYHIIQALSDITPAKTTPFDGAKASIKQQLGQQQKGTAATKWDTDTRKFFCGDSRIKYQVGYQPNPDPCAVVTSSTAATTSP